MMYLITGTSRGIGKALAELLLKKGESVIGISRTNTISHPKFTFVACDLSDPRSIEGLTIPIPATQIVLVNNAGILGEIGRISQLTTDTWNSVFQVNLLSVVQLTQKIYNQTDKNKFTLVNISSGAANRAIPSWGAYCASKAALNMFSMNFFLEERELGYTPKVYAVAPGVIDTAMQEQIRSTEKNKFSGLENFIALKENGQLYSPIETAERLLKLLATEYNGEVMYDLRTI